MTTAYITTRSYIITSRMLCHYTNATKAAGGRDGVLSTVFIALHTLRAFIICVRCIGWKPRFNFEFHDL